MPNVGRFNGRECHKCKRKVVSGFGLKFEELHEEPVICSRCLFTALTGEERELSEFYQEKVSA